MLDLLKAIFKRVGNMYLTSDQGAMVAFVGQSIESQKA